MASISLEDCVAPGSSDASTLAISRTSLDLYDCATDALQSAVGGGGVEADTDTDAEADAEPPVSDGVGEDMVVSKVKDTTSVLAPSRILWGVFCCCCCCCGLVTKTSG